MTPETYRTNFRWFTSELSFTSVADMIRAKREIEQLYGKPIITEPANYDIHFSGKFDLADLPADNPITLQSILKKYVNQSYRIKNVFSEANGYFGGWVEEYDRIGNLVESTSLNNLFEDGLVPKTEQYVLQIPKIHYYVVETCGSFEKMKEVVEQRCQNTTPAELQERIQAHDPLVYVEILPVSRAIDNLNFNQDTARNHYVLLNFKTN